MGLSLCRGAEFGSWSSPEHAPGRIRGFVAVSGSMALPAPVPSYPSPVCLWDLLSCSHSPFPFQPWFIPRAPHHRISFVPSWPRVTRWRASRWTAGLENKEFLHTWSRENAPTEPQTSSALWIPHKTIHPTSVDGISDCRQVLREGH